MISLCARCGHSLNTAGQCSRACNIVDPATRATQIAVALSCLLEAARPIASLLPCCAPTKGQVEALALAVECADQVLYPAQAPTPPVCEPDQDLIMLDGTWERQFQGGGDPL